MGQVLKYAIFIIWMNLCEFLSHIAFYYLDTLSIPFLVTGGYANLQHVYEQTLHQLDAQDKNAEDHESHCFLWKPKTGRKSLCILQNKHILHL